MLNNLINKQFGRLLVISRSENKNRKSTWLCQCDCGNIKIVKSEYLKNGDTKSCGCLHKETSSKNAQQMIKAKTEFHPMIAAARYIWRRHYYNLTFDDFYRLSQLDCFYCGANPSNNGSLKISQNRSLSSIKQSNFIYNGLDRIDISKEHILENVVPSCFICNRAKRELSIDNFYLHIKRLIYCKNNRQNIDLYRDTNNTINDDVLLNNHWLKTSVNKKFKSIYNDGDLSLKQFYRLTQLNCYYCGIVPSNMTNCISEKSSEAAKINSKYIYSGLDRLDNDFTHNYVNIIPSCKYCNYAKQILTLEQFDEWICRFENKKSQPFGQLF